MSLLFGLEVRFAHLTEFPTLLAFGQGTALVPIPYFGMLKGK